ncbi:hypothetical protein [Yoonia sp. SS1-5]|uniref:Uncharacterized protein n=1 Tax=Yoonia rhodophyticola TaxID=3137370 RepID=A0AAN0M940_9RHOB
MVRAGLVVLLVTLPAVLLPGGTNDGRQVVALVSIFAALFTIVEYSAASPSLVEFRDAPPFNRVRFCALFATVFSLSIILRGYDAPSALTGFFHSSVSQVGATTDFPFSPVRMMVNMMPDGTSAQVIETLRNAAGLAYVISILSLIWFVVLLRLQHWPRRGGAFNVWINLPTFDPTTGGDVVRRLTRDGRINIILGLLLPFLVPLIVRAAVGFGTPIRLDDPQTLIWTVAAWAFLPASIVMRGIALSRVAHMIRIQRKKAQEKAAANGMIAA